MPIINTIIEEIKDVPVNRLEDLYIDTFFEFKQGYL